MSKARAEETPNEGELVTLGQRLEQLTSERETAESLLDEARARFEKIAPKFTPQMKLTNTSIAHVWDCLIDPPKFDSPISMEGHWEIMQHILDTENKLPFATIKAAAEQSGYALADERVRSIDVEICELAAQAFEFQAATLAGARAQALALLGIRPVRPWMEPDLFHEGAMTLSRAVVALSKGEEARS